MSRHTIQKTEVYITNVCNLTCDQCNRFNNFDFKGWQAWSDYANDYKTWGQLIDLKAITIMGGEPLLNPTLVEWIHGLNDAFGIDVQVLTNGTRLGQVKGLYEAIAFARPRNGVHNKLAISLHNMDDFDEIRRRVFDFLVKPIGVNQHEPKRWNADWQWSDRNGVFINVHRQNHFDTASLQINDRGRYVLFDNDPVIAHDACTFVKYKSYHFIRAKLYKCGPVALMPEFDQQHNIDLTDDERQILNSYRPLDVENFADYHQEFFENLNKPIPQCRFCPTHKTAITIAPLRKGADRAK